MRKTVGVFQDEYIALSKKCREIAVGFLDNCRTSEEVSLLLNHPPSKAQDAGPTAYPRLREAFAYDQKEVGLLCRPYTSFC